MTSSYQPFLISEFKTSLFQYLEPWIRPNEAFEPLNNAFVYRGTLNRRNGYTFLGTMPGAPGNPIMGIKQWTNETTDLTKLVIMDTRRAAVYDPGTKLFLALQNISQTLWVDDGVTTSVNLNINWTGLTPGTVTISYPGFTMTDNGAGGFPGAGVMLNTSTVNYTTGAIVLNLSANSKGRIFTVTATLAGDYFTGNNTNFFNSTNWMGQLYFVNNADPITLYDGSTSPGTLSRPPFAITLANYTAFVNNIGTCLEVDVYQNRFLVESPTIINDGTGNGFFPQSIRWSQQFNPTDLAADITGNGGEASAPTDDFIATAEFLRNVLIVAFKNSMWTFRFTGNAFDPFRWDKINSTKSTNAPYATIAYDERITSMGAKGLLACDGVNAQRYDIPIIDQILDINTSSFAQCFGQRFDTISQSWMLYPSIESTQSNLNNSFSDKALIYNFLENTWATYEWTPSNTFSCLGLFTITTDAIWNDFSVVIPENTWEESDFSWNSYLDNALFPDLLGGDSTGNVFIMDKGISDNGNPFQATIQSTRWNPFFGSGERVQFGYIDFYYEINAPVVLTLTFFVDNSPATAITRTLTLDGPLTSDNAWKRIYLNLVGEFVSVQIQDNSAGSFKILGMILWARTSGRLTP